MSEPLSGSMNLLVVENDSVCEMAGWTWNCSISFSTSRQTEEDICIRNMLKHSCLLIFHGGLLRINFLLSSSSISKNTY